MNYPAKNTILAIVSGVLLFCAAPGAVGLWPLIWLALAPLILAVRDLPPARSFRLGLLTGIIHYTSLLYWIVIVLGVYGYLAWWVSVPALLLLALYMGLYTALFAAAVSMIARRGMMLLIWAGPALWVALDFVRSRLFTGFPWQDLAYSLYRVPLLIQAADLAGHYGITFMIVQVNCLLVAVYSFKVWSDNKGAVPGARDSGRREAMYAFIPALLLLLAVSVYSFLRYGQVAAAIDKSRGMRVTVVQGNIPQDRKWTPDMQQTTVQIYDRLSRKALSAAGEEKRSQLLIWPETALPFYLQGSASLSRLGGVESLVRESRVCLLTGVPFVGEEGGSAGSQEPRYYNSAILVEPDGSVSSRYDKEHLVPFGEYIPFRKYLPMLAPVVESMGDFTPGTNIRPLACGQVRIGVLICFESIFPELARQWVEKGANLLVNITNDAWFGRSSAPWQHLSMAVFRAVETRRSLARAANTGISGFVDPLGRIKALSSLFAPEYLTARVVMMEGKTFYVCFGHYFTLLCCIAALLALLRAGVKKTE